MGGQLDCRRSMGGFDLRFMIDRDDTLMIMIMIMRD